MKPGDKTTLGLSVSNVTDLYSIPLLIHYNPAVIQVEEVRTANFLPGGTQEIAIVQRIDEQRGEVIVSATRQPNTPGVNGTGTLLGIVVRAVAPGIQRFKFSRSMHMILNIEIFRWFPEKPPYRCSETR